ncbi:MAG: hypothetical protein VYA34_12575 [Myxococcota bacterium]|nr:hypothetical protein [Myxococcota bacterium]
MTNEEPLKWRRLMIPCLLPLLVGCTVVLDWDYEGLACGDDQPCMEGYSCFVSRCVQIQSIPRDQACSVNEQCQQGLVCPAPVYRCTSGCANLWGGGDCSAGHYCLPVNDAKNQTLIGACVLGSGCSEQGCPDGKICANLNESTSECLVACEVDFSSGAASTNCFADMETGTGAFCQRVGGASDRVLACLELENANVGLLGKSCDGAENWCGSESLCLNKRCVGLCNMSETNVCDEAEECCTLWLSDGQSHVGYCAETCS